MNSDNNENRKLTRIAKREHFPIKFGTLDELTKVAELVKTSELARPFAKLDSEKQIVYEDDGITPRVDVGSIVANLALADAMGLPPIVGLALGTKLNANAFFATLKGKELGISPITAMSKIYVIPSKRGETISVGVDIIEKCLINAKVKLTFIRNYKPTPIFKDMKTNMYIGHLYELSDRNGVLEPEYFIFQKENNNAEYKKQLSDAFNANKIILEQIGLTRVTTVRMVREDTFFDEIQHYSIQDAINAKLYPGMTTFNEVVEGKDNWILHPATMLRGRAISILGRICIADILQGVYSHEEAMEILNVDSESDLKDLSENASYEEVKE